MCYRIREAMRDKGIFVPFTGTVEADETYVGGKPRGHRIWKERIQDEIQMDLREKPKHHPRIDKAVVFGILERGGRAKTITVPEVNANTLV